MNTGLSKPFQALSKFIFSNKIRVTKTKSGKGFMIYNPSDVVDINKLSQLVAATSWKLISSAEEWNAGTKVRDASIFIGPVSKDLDMDNQASLDAYLLSQSTQ